MRQGIRVSIAAIILLLSAAAASAALPDGTDFNIRAYSANEFQEFIEVFSEMRGPLRSQILKDRKTDFENADPLAYVQKLKGEKDVQKMLEKHKLSWDAFQELMGNVVLAYFSVQPERTKASLIRQLAGYGLFLNMEQVPPEYRETVTQVLKTEAGSTLAALAMDMVVQIPEQNVAIVRQNQRTLDAMFYTRFWREALEKAGEKK